MSHQFRVIFTVANSLNIKLAKRLKVKITLSKTFGNHRRSMWWLTFMINPFSKMLDNR